MGNEFNNIIGGAGNDNLYGQGRDDYINGDSDNDTLFDTPLGAASVDSDISLDHIGLTHSIFTTLSVGTLAAAAFQISASATTASTQIFYNSSTGGLSCDGDGNGAGAATQIATLSIGLALNNTHFQIS